MTPVAETHICNHLTETPRSCASSHHGWCDGDIRLSPHLNPRPRGNWPSPCASLKPGNQPETHRARDKSGSELTGVFPISKAHIESISHDALGELGRMWLTDHTSWNTPCELCSGYSLGTTRIQCCTGIKVGTSEDTDSKRNIKCAEFKNVTKLKVWNHFILRV